MAPPTGLSLSIAEELRHSYPRAKTVGGNALLLARPLRTQRAARRARERSGHRPAQNHLFGEEPEEDDELGTASPLEGESLAAEAGGVGMEGGGAASGGSRDLGEETPAISEPRPSF